MFAKQATLAAIALTLASGVFAQSTERNVFDTETYQRLPAAVSAQGVSREAVQAEYIAQRAAKGISSFNPESYLQAQNAGAGSAIVALFQRGAASTTVASADGKTREQVRGEFLVARAHGELNPFDTETAERFGPNLRQPAPATFAQR